MFEINELTAAPHFPAPLKSSIRNSRPESLLALLAQASEGDEGIEIRMRDGEIFIALTAS